MDIITTAHAAAPDAAAGNPLGSIMMLVGFALIFYFLIWRPQSKRAKEHRDLVTSLSKGDEVITNGGLLGKIARVDDDFIILTVAEGIELKLQKTAISTQVPKGTFKSIK